MRIIQWPANRIILVWCLYVLLMFNWGIWPRIITAAPWHNPNNRLLLLSMPGLILAVTYLLMQLLFWPKLHRVVMPLLLVVGAAAAYAVMEQGVYFDHHQIANIVQTDANEVRAYLTIKGVWWVWLTGVLPAVWYVSCVRVKSVGKWYVAWWQRLAACALALGCVLLLALAAYQNYASFFRNNRGIVHQIVPVNIVASLTDYVYRAYHAARPFEQLGLDAVRSAPPSGSRANVLVLVVGETTRAQNWGLNPNAPDTTPQLAAISDVFNFPDVRSCGTATAVSLPCLFAPEGRTDYDGGRAKYRENLLDVLQRVGLSVYWQENDGGCKGLCDRIEHVDTVRMVEPQECHGNLCYSRAMLADVQRRLSVLKQDAVLVLHTNGSHGPAYFERYPPQMRRFSPTCDTNQIQDCDREQLVNTYNNTIVAEDDMLARLIGLLRGRSDLNTAVWYVSDHGESLGENGIFLHGTPYALAPDEQTRVPMIFWASEHFYQDNGLDAGCLKQRVQQAYSHDNWFASILGLMRVKTALYDVRRDLFAPCRKVR